MFRNDLATIKRPTKTKIKNQTVYNEPMVIYENIPCHLSIKSLSAVNQSQSTATVAYSFELFVDTSLNIIIEPNDIVEIVTSQGEEYKLKAGQSHKYNLTTQTTLEDIDIVW